MLSSGGHNDYRFCVLSASLVLCFFLNLIFIFKNNFMYFWFFVAVQALL